ncbi:MAG: 30S ribosomal protein S2 [Mycoplasma sp.]|nr:30S ribosomal protein S2 [Mycoplasma sp.]
MNQEPKTKDIVSKNKLLEAGVYFGHRKAHWNPKMAPNIMMTRKGVHIIDINKTKKSLTLAYYIIKKLASQDASFIFVGTRTQAKQTIRENALRTNSHYVNNRWLGGTLTNAQTIFKRVARMEELKQLKEQNFIGYTKKEGLLLSKELEKLELNLTGIRNMKQKPNIMIISNPRHNNIAVVEARKVGVKIIGIVDTNVDPDLVDIAIPANDDSIKSINLIITILADAIVSAKGGVPLYAFQEDEFIKLPEDLNKKAQPETSQKRFIRPKYKQKPTRPYKKHDIFATPSLTQNSGEEQ